MRRFITGPRGPIVVILAAALLGAAGSVSFALVPSRATVAAPACPVTGEVRVSQFMTLAPDADITAALNAAIACLPPFSATALAYGGTVTIDAGEYQVGCDIAIPTAVRLRGEGRQTTALKLKAGANCSRGVLVNASPTYQQSMAVEDLGIYAGPGMTPAIIAATCTFDGTVLRRLWLANSSGDGIRLGCDSGPAPNSGPVTVEEVVIANVAAHGVHVRGSAQGVVIRDSTVVLAVSGAGVYMEGPLGLGIPQASPLWDVSVSNLRVEQTKWGLWLQNVNGATLDGIHSGNPAGLQYLIRVSGQQKQGVWGLGAIQVRSATATLGGLIRVEPWNYTYPGPSITEWSLY